MNYILEDSLANSFLPPMKMEIDCDLDEPKRQNCFCIYLIANTFFENMLMFIERNIYCSFTQFISK